jgi:hypothetical protein
MREGMVGAWSYVWRYTIDANGTSGDPVAPRDPRREPGTRALHYSDASLTRDVGASGSVR